MLPISSLQMIASPELRTANLDKIAQDAMSKPIPLQDLEKLLPTGTSHSSPMTGAGGSSFSSMLGQFASEVNAKQAAAGDAVNGLLSGQNVSLHQAMIAMEEASVSFQLMAEVRNKLLESYQELMRMQV